MTYLRYWSNKYFDKFARNRIFSSPIVHLRTLLMTAILNEIKFNKIEFSNWNFLLTAGIAAKNFHKLDLNLGWFIVMIADSIIVALLIIQMSEIDLSINEVAIATNNADSALNLCGIKIPKKKFVELLNIWRVFVEFMSSFSDFFLSQLIFLMNLLIR